MSDKALLLGINDYESISDLRGCLNDVRDMRELLAGAYGFSDANVRQHLNEEATRNAVNDGFKWLLDGARPGDRLVFHYSGHGSYIPSKDNDEGIDELICLYGMNWDNPDSYLIDDDLGKLASGVPAGVSLTVILDSCHSGTGTRVIGPRRSPKQPRVIVAATMVMAGRAGRAADRPLADDAELKRLVQQDDPKVVLARFVERPEYRAERERRRRVRRIGASLQTKAAQLNHELLAAASETQTAADAFIAGDFHGAFTHYLCQGARELGRTSATHAIMQHATQAMLSAGYSQTPQTEGPFANDALFGRTNEQQPGSPGTSLPVTPSDAGPGIPPEPTTTGTSDFPRRSDDPAGNVAVLSQMLRVAEKFIDLTDRLLVVPATAPPQPLSTAAVRAGNQVVVYVHGISSHQAGYSIPWYNATLPYLTSPVPRREEVLWSDVVNPRGLHARPLPAPLTPEQEAVKKQIKAIIADRVAQLPMPPAARGERVASAQRDMGLSNAIGIDDFVRYMFVASDREAILACFFDVVRPLLAAGALVHVISHSWGTVVAYEGLRRLEAPPLPGRVANLFVVGAALAIGPVQDNLFSRVDDGRRPAMVTRFMNLDAIGDPVGGRIGGAFDVTGQEYLELPAVGCATFPWPFNQFPTNPMCAHSSYFNAANLTVNRDIFAHFINM